MLPIPLSKIVWLPLVISEIHHEHDILNFPTNPTRGVSWKIVWG